jgi:hypothetical protein
MTNFAGRGVQHDFGCPVAAPPFAAACLSFAAQAPLLLTRVCFEVPDRPTLLCRLLI